jgi:hypothetical protein
VLLESVRDDFPEFDDLEDEEVLDLDIPDIWMSSMMCIWMTSSTLGRTRAVRGLMCVVCCI